MAGCSRHLIKSLAWGGETTGSSHRSWHAFVAAVLVGLGMALVIRPRTRCHLVTGPRQSSRQWQHRHHMAATPSKREENPSRGLQPSPRRVLPPTTQLSLTGTMRPAHPTAALLRRSRKETGWSTNLNPLSAEMVSPAKVAEGECKVEAGTSCERRAGCHRIVQTADTDSSPILTGQLSTKLWADPWGSRCRSHETGPRSRPRYRGNHGQSQR